MADIEVTFEADDGPIRGVIGRLSREIINFAKRSDAAFGGIQSGIEGIGRAGSLSEKSLERQRRQLEALEKASKFETRSSLGLDDRQIADVQRALSSSSKEAAELSQQFQQQNAYLRDQVAQYEKTLAVQRKINDLVGEQGGIKAIEAQASPQLTSAPTNNLGLTDAQVMAIQAALAQSVTSARELTEEFIRQNAAVSQSKDIVVRQSSEMEQFGKKSSDAFKDANKGAVALVDEFEILEGVIEDDSKAIEKFSEDIIDVEEVAEDLGDEIKKSGDKAKSAWAGLLDTISTGDLPALRYALYDIGNNLQRAGLALSVFGIAPLVIAAKYEREFANVIRTNDLARDDVKDLQNSIRKDLKAIAQATPINWSDITQIATLAGQLGIAQESVGRFTETVAKFSATTDLTVNAAATAFGRLDQLIKGIDGNFENLGSAILAVGVDSVATESEIVNVSTQIASMGNLAGLSAAEIVGLSGALASLGIKPELARGTVTRLFSNIGASASMGGAKVEEFGRLTGRTADQFVSDWSSQPGAVLQDFFDGINQEGPEAERTLRSLGITSVRDIPAILRLAQNSDEVRRLIRLSTVEYIRASEVTEQYGIISGTVTAQVERLGQNFELLQASVGQSVNLFGGLIGILNLVVQGYNAIVDNPLGATISGIIIALVLLAGGFLLMVAQAAFLAAGILAVTFVLRKLGIDLNRTQISQLLFKRKIDETIVSLIAQARTAGASRDQLLALDASLKKAAIGAKLFQATMRSLLITTGIGIAIVALGAAIGYFVEQGQAAKREAEDLYGSLEGLSEALVADGKEFDKTTGKMKDGTDALYVYSKAVEDVDDKLATHAEAAAKAVDAEGDFEEIIKETNKALADQEDLLLAASDNVLEYFKQAALRDEDIVMLFGDPRFLQAAQDAGINIRELFEMGIQGIDVGPALKPITDALKAQISVLEQQMTTAELNLEAGKYDELKAQVEELETTLTRLGELEIFIDGMSETVDAVSQASDGVNNLNGELVTTAELTAFLEDNLVELNRVLFAQPNYVKKVEDSLGKLATAFAENTDGAQEAAGAIGDVVEAILSEPDKNVPNILGNLAGLLALLEAQGPSTAAAQEFVRASIAAVGNEASIQTPDIIGYARALNATVNFDATNFGDLVSSALEKIGNSAGGAGGKLKTLAEQFEELVDSMFDAINVGREAEDSIFSLGEAFGETGDEALYASDEMQDAIGAILAQSTSAEQGVANLAALFSKLASVAGGESAPSLQILRQAISQIAASFGIAEAQVQQFIATAGGGLANINLDNFNRGVQNAQKEVRTLLDYASDLEKVFSRAFDIRFARTFAIDNIAEAWEKLAEQVEDARFELEELQESQSNLGADRSLKEYFLSVAEAYGDTLRAAQLRREIAALDREQIENQRKLAEVEAIAGGELTGQGPGQRQNRQDLLDLVQGYQEYITALAESGATQKELKAATEQARQEFIQQATELGFQEAVVLEYAAAFDDVQTAISKVERNITVEANVDPALQALNELNASLRKNIRAARELNAVLGQPNPSGGGGSNNDSSDPTAPTAPAATTRSRAQIQDDIARVESQMQAAISERSKKQTRLNTAFLSNNDRRDLENEVKALSSKINNFVSQRQQLLREFGQATFAKGGFTGRGGKYDPAGIVHRGEYVVPKQYVNQSTGMPDPAFLAQLQNGMRSFAMGGFVGPMGGGEGTVMVELSPYDRKLLADAGNVQLRLNGKVVAEATNQNNLEQARRGSN